MKKSFLHMLFKMSHMSFLSSLFMDLLFVKLLFKIIFKASKTS